jgi:hypothetical protein
MIIHAVNPDVAQALLPAAPRLVSAVRSTGASALLISRNQGELFFGVEARKTYGPQMNTDEHG